MDFYHEIKDYVGFDQEDAACLEAVLPVIEPHFGGLADDFTSAVFESPYAQEDISERFDRDELHAATVRWLRAMFGGPYDNGFLDRRFRFGGLVFEREITPEILFGAMNILRVGLVKLIRDADLCHRNDRTLESVEKIIDLELTLIWKAYLKELTDARIDSAATLASGLSHELCNPLNSISLNITLLERQLDDCSDPGVQVEPILDAVRTEVQRIEVFNSKLADFTRPLNLEYETVDADEFLDSIEDQYRETLESAGIEFETTAEDGATIFGDVERLEDAVTKLIHNSVEALDGPGHIAMTVTNQGNSTVIEVSDDGPGIDGEDQPQVFDLFFTTKAKGTGLGLSLVKKIVDAHLGAVDIVSTVERGTTVRIELPQRTIARPERSRAAQ